MTSRYRAALSAAAFCGLCAAVSAQGPGVTSKDLLDGLTDPTRWLTYSGDYTGQRFSPLT